MLSSFKKWVQDVTIDLAPPPTTSTLSTILNTNTNTNNHYSNRSSSSLINQPIQSLSRPTSLEYVNTTNMNNVEHSMFLSAASPVELDLSHLNREEQEHIANVLKRAKAAEEQVSLATNRGPTSSPKRRKSSSSSSSSTSSSSSSSSSSSTSSSSTTTSSFAAEHVDDDGEEDDEQFRHDDVDKALLTRAESTNVSSCQLSENEHGTRSSIYSTDVVNGQCDASVPVKDDVKIPDDQQKISLRSNSFTGRNLTEIDENEFFYEENHRFSINDESISCKDLENSSITNYQIDECSDDDDDDAQNDEETRNQDENGTDNEQDHVKILGKAIENLQRKLPTSNDEQKRNDFLQRTFSIQDKTDLRSIRQKRFLPIVPEFSSKNFELRRVFSESRFRLPAVRSSMISRHSPVDDENDLLEIDLRRAKIAEQNEKVEGKVKQSKDQTTNTPPIPVNKAKKKIKKASPVDVQEKKETKSDQKKFEKSTSTEFTYPFAVTKLIINPSRQGVFNELGFEISGGHSSPTCTEVTARVQRIDVHHRNFPILSNSLHEGDEVLEIAGVSLRGKSALFVENLIKRIRDECEIVIRHRTASNDADVSLNFCSNVQDEQEKKVKRDPNPTDENDFLVNGSERISNDSEDTDSLSQYFQTSKSRQSSLNTTATNSTVHIRSQSVIPSPNEIQLKGSSSRKRIQRTSNSAERKSSLSLIPLKFLRKKTKSVDFPQQNKGKTNILREYDYVGDIHLQIGHNSEREQLVIRIIQAKNLLAKDANGFSDPFVKVYLLPGRDPENKRRTKYIPKTLNPVWEQTVTYGNLHREEIQYKKLEFTVWDYDRFKANDFIGQITIDLKKPNVIDDKAHWYRLEALRSRDEDANRGSSPRLFHDSTSTLNRNQLVQSKSNRTK